MVTSNVYDAAGMRVAEKVNGVWRYMVYDVGGKLVAEYGGAEQTGVGGVNYVMQDWHWQLNGSSGKLCLFIQATKFGDTVSSEMDGHNDFLLWVSKLDIDSMKRVERIRYSTNTRTI